MARAMKRRKAVELEPLRRRISSLDPSSIDQLYGLEPVYEPGTGPSGRLLPEEFVLNPNRPALR